jgi:tetratricopeptide (TPR) repeat protein
MRRLSALAILACACAHAPPQQRPAQAQEHPAPAQSTVAERQRLLDMPSSLLHKEALELMAQRSWAGAKERLEAFLAREPGHAGALFEAGWVEEQLGDAKGAAELYGRSLGSDPGYAAAAVNLSRLLQAEPERAESILRTVLRQRSGDPRLLNALATVLRRRNRLAEAAALVQKALERHPRDAEAYRNLAAIEADKGHLRLAESALHNARKLDPTDAGIPNSLGLLALRRDDVGAARAAFEEAAQLDPEFAPAWVNLGALALRYRDYATAEQAWAKAVRLEPGRWESHLARAWALEGLRKPRDARAEYEKVLAIDPHQDDALYGKALALKAEGDLAAALLAFREYVGRPGAGRLKQAQEQLAAIDLRLKHAPPAMAKTTPKSGLDLSKLPQGEDSGPSPEQLPAVDEAEVVR